VRITLERATDYDDLSARAARYLVRFLESKPASVIALPTGRTPVGAYDRLTKELEERPFDCSSLLLVDIDEIVGLAGNHPASCAHALRAQLVGRPPLSTATWRLLDGGASRPDAEVSRHEREIDRRGGLDLAVLGIGVNGHIALNEPGTPFDSAAHVSTIEASTIERLSLRESGVIGDPVLGLTLGIGTLLRAKKVLLLASGREKAEILRVALCGEITESVPASALQMHPDLYVIADQSALGAWDARE